MTKINSEQLPYMLGGLLYTPAINETIADKILDNSYEYLTSVALCLEDAIMESALEKAEDTLIKTLEILQGKEELPLIFIRVRNPLHLDRLSEKLKAYSDVFTGYILPKFDMTNGREYIDILRKINSGSEQLVYAMPILESSAIADGATRISQLTAIRELLLSTKKYILNVRVGGNDFCNLYGLRRSVSQTIYDVGVVRDILVDIVNVFARDFVVSGPVWEYFENDKNDKWAAGLKKELEFDRINGFIGKTAIHPSQLPLIYDSLRVTAEDYADMKSILGWEEKDFGVMKSDSGSRMNEKNCHNKWAERVQILSRIYGVKEK